MIGELPLGFWINALMAFALLAWLWKDRWRGYGIPACAVVATVGVWYLGDPIYNGYEAYLSQFNKETLEAGWAQVTLFLVAFAILVKPVSARLSPLVADGESNIMRMVSEGIDSNSSLQLSISRAGLVAFMGWLGLMGIALLRTDFDIVGLFLPYLGDQAKPWARGRLGGAGDALLSLMSYLHLLLLSCLGCVAVLTASTKIRVLTVLGVLLGFPYIFFGRTRNSMLAILLPGLLALVFIRLRVGVVMRFAVLGLVFLPLNYWFKLVLEARDGGGGVEVKSISDALRKGMEIREDARHKGLNMLEELFFINTYLRDGSIAPNWGLRYLAELAAPIPRSVWAGKPTIGLDYALARGFGSGAMDESSGGVSASISTGMIGGGVVNFGGFLGPIAAAALMAVWVGALCRMDLQGRDAPRIMLYGLGLILTFNLGRDITLLVLFPFIFGWLGMLGFERLQFFQGVGKDEEADSLIAGAGRH